MNLGQLRTKGPAISYRSLHSQLVKHTVREETMPGHKGSQCGNGKQGSCLAFVNLSHGDERKGGYRESLRWYSENGASIAEGPQSASLPPG